MDCIDHKGNTAKKAPAGEWVSEFQRIDSLRNPKDS